MQAFCNSDDLGACPLKFEVLIIKLFLLLFWDLAYATLPAAGERAGQETPGLLRGRSDACAGGSPGVGAHGALMQATPTAHAAPRLARVVGTVPIPRPYSRLFLGHRSFVLVGSKLNERKVPDLRLFCLTWGDNFVHVNVRLPSPFTVL